MESQVVAAKMSRETYINLVKDVMNKIMKTLPSKKYKELIDLCRKAIEQVELDTELLADKYFYIMKLALETKMPRLMTDILQTIQTLYSYEMLQGGCEDNCIYPDGQKPPGKNGRLPRLLIDAIVDAVCECAQDSDNNLQLQVIKALLTLVIAANSKVHESTLLVALKTLYSIHMTSTSQTNQNTAKGSFTQMVNTVFSKMDIHMRQGTNSENLNLGHLQDRTQENQHLDRSLIKKKEQESKDDVGGRNSQRSSETRSEEQNKTASNFEVNFTATDLYAHSLVTMMVDFVSLNEARVAKVKKIFDEETKQTDEGDRPSVNQQTLKERLKKIPLNPVPSGKKECPDVSVKNELGFDAGQFGWCIVCRSAADLFCKDTRHPVCSAECKMKHQVEISQIEGNSAETHLLKKDEARLAATDAHLVFRSIVKLSIGDQIQSRDQQVSRFAMRTKIIGLELILFVLERPKKSLFRKEFVEVIKNSLCDGLLRCSVSSERVIFHLVVSIFYCLFLHFRKYLKSIILVFIETIFLKLLDSGNSGYQYKHLILTVFDKISKNSNMLLEIFVNYDCDITQKDISERIVESLSKIANGRFTKSEHVNMISVSEEISLRSYSLQILVQMLRSFNGTIDAGIAEKKISQRMQLKQNQNDDNSETMSNPDDQEEALKQKKPASTIGDIQNQRNLKSEMGKAALKFNFKPKNGISYLVSIQIIAPEDNFQQHVKDIVKFLKTTPALDKTIIGVFLGTDKALEKACLQEFIDQFDLRGVEYVQSLKTILQGFRLPGEGQIVDRVMEIFGKKFIGDNPSGSDGCQGVMSAECVYLLSYATMMMQTSLHNPNAVKSRMSLADFAKMIKGINSGQNLTEQFVQKIYETVEREPFSLNEDDDARIKAEAAFATTFKRKQELFQKEGQGLIDRGKQQMLTNLNNKYITVDDVSPIRPMFENTWSANLATFSMILEETTDDAVANLCIEGMIMSIKICGYFDLKTERDAFVSSFAKFTLVTNDKRIKPKNIQCIQKLLDFATHQGNYLGESWFFVLECVSRLEEMINMGSGQVRDREFFDTQGSTKREASKSVNSQQKAQREAILSANCDLVVQSINVAQIDQIFQSSLQLEQEAIIQFIENLCKVSRNELRDQANPRKFSLQALVEVADLNMARIRFVWNQIWKMLSEHFIQVGSHSNLMLAIFAIDSLRQLADKFLVREEFMSFSFQKEFLKPFEQIMLNNLHTRSDIKEYIVMCITNICKKHTSQIQSGWEVIIQIFTLAAQDTEELLVVQTFTALKLAVTKHFELLSPNFVELINCLNKYSNNSLFLKQATEAQELYLLCAEKLGEQSLIETFTQKMGTFFCQRDQENMQQYPPQYGLHANQESEKAKQPPIAGSIKMEKQQSQVPTTDTIRLSVLKGVWFPMITNLTNLLLDRNLSSQKRALNTLFAVFQRAIEKMPLTFWREIFSQVLYPLLEDIQLAMETSNRKNEESDQIFYGQTFENIISRFDQFLNESFEALKDVLPCYIDILCLFIAKTTHKRLAQKCISQLIVFIQMIGSKLGACGWDQFTASICLTFEHTLPREILMIENEKQDLDRQFTRCLIQLLLVNCLKTTTESFFTLLSIDNIRQLLSVLEESNQFAHQFNTNVELRMKLWKSGFMSDLEDLPGLISQEYKSLASIIYIRFMMFLKDPSKKDDNGLMALCSKVLREYCVKTAELIIIKKSTAAVAKVEKANRSQDEIFQSLHEDELERSVVNLTPIVSKYILENINNFSDAQLKKNMKELCPILIELTLCPDQEIRTINKELLSKTFKMLI